MPFLSPNQQCQSTEGIYTNIKNISNAVVLIQYLFYKSNQSNPTLMEGDQQSTANLNNKNNARETGAQLLK